MKKMNFPRISPAKFEVTEENIRKLNADIAEIRADIKDYKRYIKEIAQEEGHSERYWKATHVVRKYQTRLRVRVSLSYRSDVFNLDMAIHDREFKAQMAEHEALLAEYRKEGN